MQINRWWNVKDQRHLFILILRMTATKICRISYNIFLFLWINLFCSIADVECRNFLKFWYCCAEKYFLFFVRFFTKLFPIAVVLLLYKNLIFFLRISSPHIVLCYRKHFYWILTNLSNLSQSKSSIVPFAKFRSDLKSVLTKHFPTMEPFTNILQSRSSYKFPDICKKISLLESHLMACNFIKK